LASLSPTTLIAHTTNQISSGIAASAPSDATGQAASAVPSNFDIRWQLAAERAGKVGVGDARLRAEQRLAAAVPGLTIHRDEVSTLPKMVLSTTPGVRLASKGASDPVAAARAFLSANRDLYALESADVSGLDVVYVSIPKGAERGATIVRFAQRVNGVPVFGAEMAVAMTTREHAVAATSGVIYPKASVGLGAKAAALSMSDALAKAASDLGGRVFAGAEFASSGRDQAGYTRYDFVADRGAENPLFGDGLRAQQVVFPIAAGETVPAYYVEVNVLGEPSGSGPYFSFVVSAVDGSILFRNNLTASDSYGYRVFGDTASPFRPFDSPQGIAGTPHPTGITDQYQAPYVTQNDITVESLIGPTDPWLAPGATATTGNNVDAYLDIAGTDGFTAGDVRGATSAAGQFFYTFDPAAATTDTTVRQVKTTHLFYYNNWLHDVWYQKGFDEVSRNAQTDNYGRGGSGNDSIKAEGEDRSGTNNANMSTPADGSRPRMQMFRFTGSGQINPQRDSSTDFGILAHEWMHYMSNRLVGNASGLNNNQGGSMGEGWGDWNGLLHIVRTGDDLDGVFTTGAWCTYIFWNGYLDNYYFGIRRYPYSTRTDKAPLTFKDIGPGLAYPAGVSRNTNIGGSASEVHNAGEIWCQMLWEGTANLMKTYGVDDGRDRMMRYVADGMKMTPSGPTYGQARDGVIAAANATDPNDVPLLWQGFAKRGIGEGAVSPPSGSFNHSGIVESFVAPAALPNDSVSVVLNGTYFLKNVLTAGSADLSPNFGASTLVPLAGNWDGGVNVGDDGADHIGAYDPTSGAFFLRNANAAGVADVVFTFGAGGLGYVPVTGDWDGNGSTTVGLYNPATGFFFLRNSNTSGPADVVFSFGAGGAGFVPVVGDWNNDGVDTVGLYNPANGAFFLKNSNTNGPADLVFSFGVGGAQPVAGDWNDDGTDTVGLYFPASGTIFLKNANSNGPADRVYSYGPTGSLTALAGNFDGQ
jgi:hypothetical protein